MAEAATDPGHVDVVIVGAGIAGCALAAALAADGRHVRVFERDMTVPDTFRGELLQPAGLTRLQELGLGHCTEGIDAQDCRGYVVYLPQPEADGRHRHVVIPYPTQAYADGTAAVARGRSFHHGRLVDSLRKEIRARPRIDLVEATVTDLIEDPDDASGAIRGVWYKLKGSDQAVALHAPLTVDCSGCFSKFRPLLSAAKPSYSSHFVALLLRDVELPYPEHGYVTLADPAPVLMYAIGTGELRALVAVPDPLPSLGNGDLQRYLSERIAPQMPPFLEPAFRRAVAERIRSVPCNVLHVEALRRPGAFAIGDAINMRHPLTGGGMTVALTDAQLLARLLRSVPDLHDHAAVQAATAPFFQARSPTASTINILAQCLYDVFCGGNKAPALAPVRDACFAYFPYFGTDTLGLLSGLNPSPLALSGHFFAVAGFAAGQLLWPVPTPWGLWRAVRAFYSAYKVIEGPLLQHFWRRNNWPYRAAASC